MPIAIVLTILDGEAYVLNNSVVRSGPYQRQIRSLILFWISRRAASENGTLSFGSPVDGCRFQYASLLENVVTTNLSEFSLRN